MKDNHTYWFGRPISETQIQGKAHQSAVFWKSCWLREVHLCRQLNSDWLRISSTKVTLLKRFQGKQWSGKQCGSERHFYRIQCFKFYSNSLCVWATTSNSFTRRQSNRLWTSDRGNSNARTFGLGRYSCNFTFNKSDFNRSKYLTNTDMRKSKTCT